MGKDGNLYIGDIRFLNGEPVSSRPVEMTSQGPHINGLDAYKWISAGYACHIYGSSTRAYIQPAYEMREDLSTPVVNLSSGTTVGFRYLQFGSNTPKRVEVVLGEHKPVKVNVRIDSYRGRIIASGEFAEGEMCKLLDLNTAVIGRHAVYFEFLSQDTGAVAAFDRFAFSAE